MNKTLWYVAGGVVLAAVLGFAYYAISPLFINIEVNEALPGQERTEESVQSAPELTPDVTDRVPTVQPALFPVVDTPAHPASGFVRVVEADGKQFIRYEDYKTINGPDLYVYLAKDLDAKEFVDLGRLRATEGNVNYEVPAGVDVSDYRYVLTWCKAFGVLFNSADLGAQ
jgi:hypothetical protein